MTRVADLDLEKLQLEDAVAWTRSGDVVVVIRDGAEIARLVESVRPVKEKKSLLGAHLGWVSYISNDF